MTRLFACGTWPRWGSLSHRSPKRTPRCANASCRCLKNKSCRCSKKSCPSGQLRCPTGSPRRPRGCSRSRSPRSPTTTSRGSAKVARMAPAKVAKTASKVTKMAVCSFRRPQDSTQCRYLKNGSCRCSKRTLRSPKGEAGVFRFRSPRCPRRTRRPPTRSPSGHLPRV